MKWFTPLAMGIIVAMIDGSMNHLHKIVTLPHYDDDMNPINFDQYAGNMELSTQSLFYWFIESETNLSTDPLVLWLSGGPGCSSLTALFNEIGPFVVDSELKLHKNPFSWNRHTNIIFLDSPAGAGFSHPHRLPSDYNDHSTAFNVREFLVKFVSMYPAFNGREVYISGESYAGMSIPFLVALLLQNPIPNVKLTGFTIGNPFTDVLIDGNSNMEYYYSHGLISLHGYSSLMANCKDQLVSCLHSAKECSEACNEILLGTILSPSCLHLDPYFNHGNGCLLQNHQAQAFQYRKAIGLQNTEARQYVCNDEYTSQYLNLPEVLAAIHAPLDITWQPCSSIVRDTYTKSISALPAYRTILDNENPPRALIYSGDADSIVNFLGTQQWIQQLNLTRHSEWSAWIGPDQHVAGFIEKYQEGLTFMTIQGAGHLAPVTRPLQTLHMFECFVFPNVCSEFDYTLEDVEVVMEAAETSALTATDSDASFDAWVFFSIPIFFLGLTSAVVVCARNDEQVQYTPILTK